MLRRIKLSNVADNRNVDREGRLDKNHPRWYFSAPVYARSIRITKVTLPLSYYSGVREADSSSYFEANNIQYPIELKPAGFRNMMDMMQVLTYRFNDALPNGDTVLLAYDEVLDRLSIQIQGATPGDEPSEDYVLHVNSFDLADLLGVEKGSTLTFEVVLINKPARAVRYKESPTIPEIDIEPQNVDSDDLIYPNPYSPSIYGPTFLFLRSDILNGYTAGGYGTGTGIVDSGNILAAIEISQPFGTIVSTQLYDSCLLKFYAEQQAVQAIDLYFTAEAKRRNLNEAQRLIDFNGQRWSVELELEVTKH